MKWLDLPPVWLFACLLIAWGTRGTTDSVWFDALGWLMISVAIVLVLLAALAFRRARTTIIPHREPSALVTDGIFALTRNPIYLADVLVLAGFSLFWSSWIGLLLVVPLAFILHRRFILAEEARLNAAFGEDFADYAGRVRRWL